MLNQNTVIVYYVQVSPDRRASLHFRQLCLALGQHCRVSNIGMLLFSQPLWTIDSRENDRGALSSDVVSYRYQFLKFRNGTELQKQSLRVFLGGHIQIGGAAPSGNPPLDLRQRFACDRNGNSRVVGMVLPHEWEPALRFLDKAAQKQVG